MNYTYLLRCADGTLYCGWTNHLAARVAAHNAGKGAKYTKTRRPVVLAYYEEYATRSEAMRREAAIKKLTKKEKEAKKNQHVTEIKEVRMSPGIDTNDFNVKVKSALKFLKDGNRVKVTVRFRGREMAHTDIGKTLLAQFGEMCAETANIERAPKLDGRHMSMFLGPKTNK